MQKHALVCPGAGSPFMLPMVHLTLPVPFTSEYFPDLMVLAAASFHGGYR